jgi:hypothetical protein
LYEGDSFISVIAEATCFSLRITDFIRSGISHVVACGDHFRPSASVLVGTIMSIPPAGAPRRAGRGSPDLSLDDFNVLWLDQRTYIMSLRTVRVSGPSASLVCAAGDINSRQPEVARFVPVLSTSTTG